MARVGEFTTRAKKEVVIEAAARLELYREKCRTLWITTYDWGSPSYKSLSWITGAIESKYSTGGPAAGLD